MTGAGSGKPEAEGKCGHAVLRAQHPHEKLDAWQESIKLVKSIYSITALFPSSQQYGLTNQLQRAAVSVPANLAEGSGRGTPGEMARFYQIARGSLMELDTLTILAIDLGYLDPKAGGEVRRRIDKVNLLLNGMIRYQKSR